VPAEAALSGGGGGDGGGRAAAAEAALRGGSRDGGARGQVVDQINRRKAAGPRQLDRGAGRADGSKGREALQARLPGGAGHFRGRAAETRAQNGRGRRQRQGLRLAADGDAPPDNNIRTHFDGRGNDNDHVSLLWDDDAAAKKTEVVVDENQDAAGRTSADINAPSAKTAGGTAAKHAKVKAMAGTDMANCLAWGDN